MDSQWPAFPDNDGNHANRVVGDRREEIDRDLGIRGL